MSKELVTANLTPWFAKHQVYPFLNSQDELGGADVDEGLRLQAEALITYFHHRGHKAPDNKLRVYVYNSFTTTGEERTWVLYETIEDEFTYNLNTVDFASWIEALNGDGGFNPEIKEPSIKLSRQHLEDVKAFTQQDRSAEVGLLNGDIDLVEIRLEAMQTSVTECLRRAVEKTNALISAYEIKRDHELYLLFHPDFTTMTLRVGLEKIDPLLKNGELQLGSNFSPLSDWTQYPGFIVSKVKALQKINLEVNKVIKKNQELVSKHPLIQERFKEGLKQLLLACGHFTRIIYGVVEKDCQEALYLVANEILGKLDQKKHMGDGEGMNLALDVNSWYTWEYFPDKPPIRVMDPDLNFYESVLNRYTQSFTTALTSFLMKVNNSLIRPYDYRVSANADDGVAIGSMRLSTF